MWRIVETDNFGGDYPDESFVGPALRSESNARKVAKIFNDDTGEHCRRCWKVVEHGYKLVPGFEP